MNILIIDDEKGLRNGLKKVLSLESHNIYEAEDLGSALKVIAQTDIHLVLLDLKLKEGHGYDILLELKKREPLISIIIITGYGDIESAVSCMRAGAINYLTKPINHDLLISLIKNEEAARILKFENIRLQEQLKEKSYEEFISSKNEQIQKNEEIIAKIKDLKIPVLLLGETGTGKEITAQKIHYSGIYKDEPFIGVNCAALNENILESELFGHEKGAFTGAYCRKLGRFELARDGTLFLDEIGDMSLALQAKLLRVLQEKSYERMGGTQSLKAKCRIIAATNKNIHSLIENRQFRNDLYFRLSVITLPLPPLRERKEDIPDFAKFFLAEANREFNKQIKGISAEALEKIINYDWPGNIRQLKNVIINAVLLAEKDEIGLTELSLPQPKSEIEINLSQATNLLTKKKIYFEKELISQILVKNNKNISRTAKELGISRKALYEKIKKYGL